MAEEELTAASLPASPLHKSASPFSSSFRFLLFADDQDSAPNPGNHFELDESDVIWPPGLYTDLYTGGGSSPAFSTSDGGVSSPNSPSGRRRRSFLQEKFGLSAALSEDRVSPSQQRLTAINVPFGGDAAVEVSKVLHQSAPVKVPVWPRGRRQRDVALATVENEYKEEAEDEMLPPHLIVARSHVMAFSVFEGVGRTLKGRDLRRVRNAVFQKTGFLD